VAAPTTIWLAFFSLFSSELTNLLGRFGLQKRKMLLLFLFLVLIVDLNARQHVCNLGHLGQRFDVDKFNSKHRYEHLYCDVLLPLHQKNFTMLEIGLGCGHYTTCPRSAPLWKTYFPNVDYHAIDFVDGDQNVVYANCMENLKRQFPSVSLDLTGKVFFGDQANRTFLHSVIDKTVKKTGHKFQLIIDDGGHAATQEKVSFQELWPYLDDGGVYIIEDLQADDGMPRVLANWLFLLMGAYKTSPSENSNNYGGDAISTSKFVQQYHETYLCL
jgi:hypothetical protein